MAGIRDVAKRAGVAACTVSRVLNGTATVAPETKMKIERAMKELNYVPNELARGMFLQKSGIIAMLVPSIKHPFFSSLADCIERYLYENGYKLMLCSTSGSIEREKDYLNIFKSNLIDGVIMAVNSLEDEDYLQFQKPMVMLDYSVDGKVPFVVSDHKMGGALAAGEFIKSHCKYVLHLCAADERKKVLSYESHKELERLLGEQGIRVRSQEIKWNDFDLKGYRELAELILNSYPEIDGIMAADMPATAFYEAARKMGKKVPQELSIVAYDGTYASEMTDCKLTTVVQQLETISEKVVYTIFQLLRKEKVDTEGIFIPVKLEKGSTTS